MSKRNGDAAFEQCAKRLCVKVANLRLDETETENDELNFDMALENPYENVNAELRRLHQGNNMHRGTPRRSYADLTFAPNEPASASRPVESTQFLMADIVQCGHGERSRCLECIGRKIHQVPLSIHRAFDAIFLGAPSDTKCNLAESQAHGLPLRSLVSGEIYFPAFASLLGDIGISRKEFCFLDLGSGRGKAVVAVALLFPNTRTCGIEIRPQLYQVSEGLVLDPQVRSRVRFVQGNFFDVEWSEADIILVNGTGFDEVLVHRVEKKLDTEAKTGAYIISLSTPLRASRLKQLRPPRRYRMAWGNASVYTFLVEMDIDDSEI